MEQDVLNSYQLMSLINSEWRTCSRSLHHSHLRGDLTWACSSNG